VTYAQTQHDDHDDVVGQGEIDIVHDQELVISEARLSLDVGITRRFSASLMVPLRIVNTSIRYLDTGGAEVQLVNDSIHHRNETVTGIADPMLLGAASFAAGGWRLTGRAGLTIPIGRTEENPFTLGDMGLAHQHIQLGTGTANPVVVVEAARSLGSWRVGGFAMSQQVVYEGGKGYQAGDRYAAGVVARRRLSSRWSMRGTVDALGETAERWDGIKHTDDGNQGRFDLILGVGASWAATSTLGIDIGLKVPVVTHAVGGQLSMPALVEIGASWSFGGAKAAAAADSHEHGEDHDHDHEHGEDEHGHEHDDDEHEGEAKPWSHPDTTGLDVTDVGKPGEAVDLVPVPGKITIFDFWAIWCEPCKVLEPALVDIARAHPDIVAIRRIDAVEWDSAAVERHLTPKGFNLPHLKVFDASGRLVMERSPDAGKLEEFIEDVRKLVDAEATKRAAATTSAAPTPAPVPPVESPPVVTSPTPVPTPTPPKPKPARPAPAPVFQIVVTARGFEPNNVVVPVGKPVRLRFERKYEKTCATEIVMELDGKKIVKDLPLNQPVELKLTFSKPGNVGYACAMDMLRGSITAQ
jgi:thiol-disulfide isomerase/thioredoxin/plastocyanin